MVASESVSTLSIIFMAISAALSILTPVSLIIIFGVKRKLKWKATLYGALLFVVFVLFLERIMHILVLGINPAQSVVFRNPVIYMLYGGFAAGIFEETARLLGFKFLIKVNDNEGIETGISYGLGHGGIEAVLIGGLASINNFITSVMQNSGMMKEIISTLSGQQLEALTQGINALLNTPSYLFLIAGIERVVALSLQVALSLFVFKAVVEKKWSYFVYAILIHAGVDAFAVLFQRDIIKNIFLLEGIVLLITIITLVFAFKLNKNRFYNKQDISE